MKLPKVSVVTITYAHEKYIIDTIKGVLNQNYDGEIEFIIANDNSPDNTENVIKNYLKSIVVPSNISINYVKHDINIGMMGNFIWAVKQCSGKYIALCEGDDYWTDPVKLQKQVDFLEADNQYVMCFHKVNVLKVNGEIVDDFLTKIPEQFHLRETLLIRGNYIHTPSVMFRNNLIDYPSLLDLSPIGDFLLYALLTKFGNIGYINESMAVYRHNAGVLSKTIDRAFINELTMNLILLKIVDNEKDSRIVIRRITEFVLFHLSNLPLKMLKRNIKNIPTRFFTKYFK